MEQRPSATEYYSVGPKESRVDRVKRLEAIRLASLAYYHQAGQGR